MKAVDPRPKADSGDAVDLRDDRSHEVAEAPRPRVVGDNSLGNKQADGGEYDPGDKQEAVLNLVLAQVGSADFLKPRDQT